MGNNKKGNITMYHSFERIINDSMMTDEDGNEWIVNDDDGWDPIMGDIDDYPETDDEWLDDFQGEEDFA